MQSERHWQIEGFQWLSHLDMKQPKHHCLQQKETSQGTKKDSPNYNHAKHSLRPASITNLTCSKKKKIQPPLNFNKITLNDLLTTTDVHPLYTPLYLTLLGHLNIRNLNPFLFNGEHPLPPPSSPNEILIHLSSCLTKNLSQVFLVY